MPIETTTNPSQGIPPRRLWFGAVGAAVAWALQGLTCFLISTQACADGTGHWGPLSPVAVQILIGVVSAGYLFIAVASAFVSYRNWRILSDRRLMEAEGYGREEYMALVGIFVGATTVVGLIWSGIPPFFVSVCNTVR